MGEVKSVKVDNWGVFFLQKLQNFFNKTDYCDLTLQFRDNSQLKVHRLVLSACTDYFNALEQTCEIIDDALIMPNEFQADVVVPIVNFMYTGTLEFELKMYGKLLRTAKEMNMTVLLKLLEAHRRTMENVNRQQRPPSPKGIRRRPGGPAVGSPQQQRVGIASPQGRPGQQQGQGQGQGVMRRVAEPSQQRVGGGVANLLRSGGGINNRTQFISEASAQSSIIKQEPAQPASPFEQLRKGYNNNKRPAQTSLLSPPSKKPSLEDVKEFAEQQRMRKQIAAEYGDHDPEYDGMMLYDDVHAGDDDDDDIPPQPSTSKQHQEQQLTMQSGTQTTQLEHGTTTIILKQDSPSQTPTIIVKDSSNTKLNHTKIIAEVLRQYPHIVKGHKNIKLKIMPNNSPDKPPPVKRGSPAPQQLAAATSPHKKLHVSFKSDKSTPMITSQQQQQQQQQQQKILPMAQTQKQVIGSQQQQSSVGTQATAALQPQKRRIDSKTMHTLIALGAENTTGPWLCLRCGVNGRPISIPSYRGFRRHLINTHKEAIDAALCEHCGYRSSNNRELHFHMYQEHQAKSLLYTFSECVLCNKAYQTKSELEQHMIEAHSDDNKQHCIYCNKVFVQELQLYRHMKSYHKAQALEDGIIDETDEEYLVSQDEDDDGDDEQQEQELVDEKVRILSDISLPAGGSIVQQQEEQLMEQANEEQEVKFVGADGNEVELTEEQRKEILSQLNQQQAGAASGGVVMVLSEPEAADGKPESDAKSAAGTEEDYDDSQIYSELAAVTAAEEVEEEEEVAAAAADESKESIDNLEWAENLISEQELEAEQSSKEPKAEKRRDDISEKLKELTGDWTEDENEDDVDDKPTDATEAAAEAAAADKQIVEETVEEAPASTSSEKNVGEAIASEEPEEDDIDLALQTLHKDGDEDEEMASAEVGAVVETEATAATIVAETPVEKMDVDDIINAATAADATEATEVDKLLAVKEEQQDEEELKETPKTTAAKKPIETAPAEVEAAKAAEDDVHLEAENIRKELLDELIAESEKPIAAEEVVEEELVPAEAVKAATLEPESEIKVEQPVENNDAASKAKAAEASSTAPVASVEEKPDTSDAIESSEEKAQEALAASADKVKSLISEWADDDDDDDNDDEDENGVSATAKEEL